LRLASLAATDRQQREPRQGEPGAFDQSRQHAHRNHADSQQQQAGENCAESPGVKGHQGSPCQGGEAEEAGGDEHRRGANAPQRGEEGRWQNHQQPE